MTDKTPRTITRAQYLQFVGLITLARKYADLEQELRKAAEEIAGDDESGHVSDIIWRAREIDEGLQIMNVTVVDTPPAEPQP